MALEAPVLKNVMLEASRLGFRLFRNNRGLFYTQDGRLVRAGLEAEGASDTIGFVPVVITPEMVGRTIAVFLAVETKKPGWMKPRTETERKQENFIRFVNGHGGIGMFLSDAADLKKGVDKAIKKT